MAALPVRWSVSDDAHVPKGVSPPRSLSLLTAIINIQSERARKFGLPIDHEVSQVVQTILLEQLEGIKNVSNRL
jgi:hypothetical protein